MNFFVITKLIKMIQCEFNFLQKIIFLKWRHNEIKMSNNSSYCKCILIIDCKLLELLFLSIHFLLI